MLLWDMVDHSHYIIHHIISRFYFSIRMSFTWGFWRRRSICPLIWTWISLKPPHILLAFGLLLWRLGTSCLVLHEFYQGSLPCLFRLPESQDISLKWPQTHTYQDLVASVGYEESWIFNINPRHAQMIACFLWSYHLHIPLSSDLSVTERLCWPFSDMWLPHFLTRMHDLVAIYANICNECRGRLIFLG